jgi:hypothetical protein
LKCGCADGYERCMDCRAGIHPDQRVALAITLGIIAADLASKQEPLGAECEKILHENLWQLYAR